MTPETVLLLWLYTATLIFTPGPVNLSLLGISLGQGWRAALPFMLGVQLGTLTLTLGVGAGLGHLFERLPVLLDLIRYIGSAYLMYLAWKIATTTEVRAEQHHHSLGVTHGWLAQAINPKTCMAVATVYSQFIVPASPFVPQAVWIIVVFAVNVLIGNSCWVLCGHGLKRWVQSSTQVRWMNRAMGVTLAVLVVMLNRGAV